MIKANGLTKKYGPLTAVDDVSFKVEAGEVLGFLGPNGAGKTTTMRMFAGFVPPTAGYAEIDGFRVDSHPTQAKARLGYLPEGAPAYGEMTPWEFLDFMAAIRGFEGRDKRERVGSAIERLNLENARDRRIDTLSKGFKRRVGLAQAILHDPPVLILDEPTDGLDPNQKHEVRELIADMSANKIIVISTHILEEVDAVCNRAIIISSGRVVADETPEHLINRSRYHNAVTVKFARSQNLEAVADELKRLPGVDHVETDDGSRSVTVFPQPETFILATVGKYVSDSDWDIEQLHLESGRLDEVFRSITTAEAA